MTGRGRAWRPLLVSAVVSGLLLLAAPPASAHSELERSDPPSGGTVAEGRTAISLWFTEPVDGSASTFTLRSLDGAEVDATVTEVDGGFVALQTAPMPAAVYGLDWDVLSGGDGHREQGTVVFGVGISPGQLAAAGAAGGSGTSTPALLLRWLDLVAVLVAIGGLVVARWILPASSPGRGSSGTVGTGSARVALWALVAAVGARALVLLIGLPRSGGGWGSWSTAVEGALATSWGRLWLGRELLLVAGAGALWWCIRGTAHRQRWLDAALGAVVCAVVLGSLAGHASTLPARSTAAALMSAVHVVAAGVWVGGLVVLLVATLHGRRRGDPGRLAGTGVWRRFSPWAATSVVVVLATGIYEAGRYLGPVGSIASTTYGTAVAGKVLLLALALTVAAANTLIVNPRIAAPVARRLGRTPGWTPVAGRRLLLLVTVEAVVLTAAVLAAALLTSVPTARDAALADTAVGPQTSTVDDLFVTFEEVAAGPTSSQLIVGARAVSKLETSAIDAVEVQLSGPADQGSAVTLDEVEPGRYSATVDRLDSGTWVGWVVVRRAGLPDAVTSYEWSVPAPESAQTSPLELAGTLAALAFLVLLVLLAASVLYLRTRPASEPSTARRAVRVHA